MCILICANSKASEWFDFPQALAYRQSLQLCPVYGSREELVEILDTGAAAQLCVVKRSAWIEACGRYRAQPMHRRAQLVEPSGSSCEWQKALQTIAKTW